MPGLRRFRPLERNAMSRKAIDLKIVFKGQYKFINGIFGDGTNALAPHRPRFRGAGRPELRVGVRRSRSYFRRDFKYCQALVETAHIQLKLIPAETRELAHAANVLPFLILPSGARSFCAPQVRKRQRTNGMFFRAALHSRT